MLKPLLASSYSRTSVVYDLHHWVRKLASSHPLRRTQRIDAPCRRVLSHLIRHHQQCCGHGNHVVVVHDLFLWPFLAGCFRPFLAGCFGRHDLFLWVVLVVHLFTLPFRSLLHLSSVAFTLPVRVRTAHPPRLFLMMNNVGTALIFSWAFLYLHERENCFPRYLTNCSLLIYVLSSLIALTWWNQINKFLSIYLIINIRCLLLIERNRTFCTFIQ